MTKTSITNKIVHINALSYGQYQPGAIVLGYVLHIHHESVTMSLPGGLTGIVPIEEISDTMHKLILQQRSLGDQSRKRKTVEVRMLFIF